MQLWGGALCLMRICGRLHYTLHPNCTSHGYLICFLPNPDSGRLQRKLVMTLSTSLAKEASTKAQAILAVR